MSYESVFVATPQAESVLRSGRMISPEESPADMVERVVTTIVDQEAKFDTGPSRVEAFAAALGGAMDRRDIVMSTPIMTNAGRYTKKPLSACTVPTLSLHGYDRADLTREINTLHQQGMGTGFNLDDTDNPVGMLRMLNDIAVSGTHSGREDRPVGNMAVLSVYHPKVLDFIEEKTDAPATGAEWKFNISVDVDEAFMEAAQTGGPVTLRDGTQHLAAEIFEKICSAATVCADPGLIFLDRMNRRNPYPGLGSYKTTAPCAEVGLVEGETCQFGYINVGNFVSVKDGLVEVDYSRLQMTTDVLTRALDDALEISIGLFDTARSKFVMTQKRKIGIGICRIADALTVAGLPYDSDRARGLIQDILSFVNFQSKLQSVQLARERGSCGAMAGMLENLHLDKIPLLDRLYSAHSTYTVEGFAWKTLATEIKSTRMLRNISTIALPPTGRSALVIDASTGVEPHFTLSQANSHVRGVAENILSSRLTGSELRHVVDSGYTNIPKRPDTAELRDVLAVAREISPLGHLAMAGALQIFTDEAISKTVNLPEGATFEDVADIYRLAHDSGMSGVTIYVDGTHKLQPKDVK